MRPAVVQMDRLIRRPISGDRMFDWDTEREYIDIPDPRLLFRLRWGVRVVCGLALGLGDE